MRAQCGAGCVQSTHTSTKKSLVLRSAIRRQAETDTRTGGLRHTGTRCHLKEEALRWNSWTWTCLLDRLETTTVAFPNRFTGAASMSTVEGARQREEGDYGRAAKRLKTEDRETEEREEGEEELEEGEDSDTGSLTGNGESAVDNRARWSANQYGAGRRVRSVQTLSNVTLQRSITDRRVCVWVCARASVSLCQ